MVQSKKIEFLGDSENVKGKTKTNDRISGILFCLQPVWPVSNLSFSWRKSRWYILLIGFYNEK